MKFGLSKNVLAWVAFAASLALAGVNAKKCFFSGKKHVEEVETEDEPKDAGVVVDDEDCVPEGDNAEVTEND